MMGAGAKILAGVYRSSGDPGKKAIIVAISSADRAVFFSMRFLSAYHANC
jgi:hypothetical protein